MIFCFIIENVYKKRVKNMQININNENIKFTIDKKNINFSFNKQGKKSLYYSKNLNEINKLLLNCADIIINPFSDKFRFFDNETTNLMEQKKTIGIINLNVLSEMNRIQQSFFLKNARIFVSLCKKKKINLVITSGLGFNDKQEISNYVFFDIDKEKHIAGWKSLENKIKGVLNEKKS